MFPSPPWDDDHGNVLPHYAAMGKPVDPTPAQVDQLNRETSLPSPYTATLQNGKLQIALEPNALALIQVQP